MSIARPSRVHWLAVTTFILISTHLAGCRLGNRVVAPPAPPEPAPGISGYYVTAPNFSTTYYCMNTTDKACYESGKPEDIPGMILEVMSSPVGYVVQDNKSGAGKIFNAVSGNEENLPLDLADPSQPENGILRFEGGTSAAPLLQAPLWETDYGCLTQLVVVENAQLHRYEKYDRTHPSGLITSGTIQYQAKVYRLIQDVSETENCLPALQLLTQCYQNSAQCGTTDPTLSHERHSFAQNLFGPYIRRGTMSESDIVLATVLAYEVNYR